MLARLRLAAKVSGSTTNTGHYKGESVRILSIRVLVLGLLLVLAACGGSAPATGGGDPDGGDEAQPDAPAGTQPGECELLSLDEVSAATGAEVTGSIGSNQGGQAACNYNDADGIPVATYVVMTSAPEVAQAGYDAITDGTEPVSGIGDQAKWHELGTLYVLEDGDLFIVSVITPELDIQEKRDVSIDLARMVIDRSD
jgi:Protein of unknown function (DUF3558)